MEYKKDRAWLEVDLGVLKNNYRKIKNFISKDSDIIIVTKADAYGLGAAECAKTLEKEGCRYFASAYIEEAMELRENGIRSPIIVLGVIPEEYVKEAANDKIEMSVSNYETAKKYGQIAFSEGKKLGG